MKTLLKSKTVSFKAQIEKELSELKTMLKNSTIKENIDEQVKQGIRNMAAKEI